jgi:chromosome segregation ATPase
LLLANRLQTKQKENEQLLAEIKTLREKLDTYDSEVKLQKKLLDRANQPHSYIMADVERAERELGLANKRIKLMEDELKKARKEIENLMIQKRGLSEDLQRLISKRQEIENLQATLQSVIMQSGSKKTIDVEELRQRIVDGVKGKMTSGMSSIGNKHTTADLSQSMISYNGVAKENSSKRMNNRNSRSKSPGYGLGNNASFDEIPERGSAVKID